MKKTIKRLICVFLIFCLITAPAVFSSAESADNTGRLFDSYTPDTSSVYTLRSTSRVFIVSSSDPDEKLAETAQLIARQLGTLPVFGNKAPDIIYGAEICASKGDFILEIDSSADISAEGYIFNVGKTAKITAKDTRGLIYGSGMLMKVLRNSTSVIGFSGKNAPDTKERTVMLDTGRKYFSAEWIMNFIRQISWMGYNTLELHFSEDGGFRADFWDKNCYGDANGDGKAYSPVNDFSWICGSHVQSWVKDPYRNDPDKDKYLTTQELIDICKVAREYQIDIIPSFDSPAHLDYLTWKFEQHYKVSPRYAFIYNGTTYNAKDVNGCINYMGTKGAASPTYPNYTTIDITNETAKSFVFAIYADIADFFKEFSDSTDFSIGADEVNLSKSGVKWKYDKFPAYINSLNRMLNAKGYTCRMYNDFIGSKTNNITADGKARYKFDKNIEILYWTSNFNQTTGKYNQSIWPAKFFWETETSGSEDFGDGNRIIYNCIASNCYYVLRVAASTTKYPNMDARNPENRNWSFYSSNEQDIYNKWYPADVSAKGVYSDKAEIVPEASLGGGYFLIWNDYAALNTQTEIWNGVKDNTGTSDYFYSLFDRMWSNIIKMWNSDINKTVSFAEFSQIRDTFGYFPGFTDCNRKASLPEAGESEKVYYADHTELIKALSEKISDEEGLYSQESFAAYEEAYNQALRVHKNSGATQSEIEDAIRNIQMAENNLVLKIYDDAKILDITKISRVTPLGKKAGLIVTTKTYAETLELSLDGQTVTTDEIISDIQPGDDNDVKIWYLNFTPEEKGRIDYTLTVNGLVSEDVEIIVK
ncbi:MAG: family 20 glycosylhydrolase [Clostridia bacterium]|nr:family 20 glycosylhydrolase [Clostridia bacterium]